MSTDTHEGATVARALGGMSRRRRLVGESRPRYELDRYGKIMSRRRLAQGREP
jgi:hypothetical protein